MPAWWHASTKNLKSSGGPKRLGRREEAEHLVAPRSGERMLHHRQQLDVREAQLLHVRHEAIGELAVGEEAVALFRHARPRAEVHFVDRHRPIEPRACARRAPPSTRRRATRSARCRGRSTPSAAAPRTRRRTDRSSSGSRRSRVRISNLYFSPSGRSGMKISQMPPGASRRIGVDAAVPAVEVADHADAVGVGRPDREVHAGRVAERRCGARRASRTMRWCVPSPSRCRSKSVSTRP